MVSKTRRVRALPLRRRSRYDQRIDWRRVDWLVALDRRRAFCLDIRRASVRHRRHCKLLGLASFRPTVAPILQTVAHRETLVSDVRFSQASHRPMDWFPWDPDAGIQARRLRIS